MNLPSATAYYARTEENGGGFCCLGVAALIAFPDNWIFEESDVDDSYPHPSYWTLDDGHDESDKELIPDRLAEQIGLTNDIQTTLSKMNDGRGLPTDFGYIKQHAFPEIADWIDANL